MFETEVKDTLRQSMVWKPLVLGKDKCTWRMLVIRHGWRKPALALASRLDLWCWNAFAFIILFELQNFLGLPTTFRLMFWFLSLLYEIICLRLQMTGHPASCGLTNMEIYCLRWEETQELSWCGLVISAAQGSYEDSGLSLSLLCPPDGWIFYGPGLTAAVPEKVPFHMYIPLRRRENFSSNTSILP